MDKIASALSIAFGHEWREHPEASGYYFSNSGHAARATTRRSQLRLTLLKGCECGIGYRAISHPIGGGRYGRIYIHRAVCQLFNGPATEPSMCVRHLDTDLRNNRASNLAWGTPSDNAKDAIRMGKNCPGERNGMARLTAERVAAMRQERADTRKTYKQLAADFGVSTMAAYRATTGQSWN